MNSKIVKDREGGGGGVRFTGLCQLKKAGATVDRVKIK